MDDNAERTQGEPTRTAAASCIGGNIWRSRRPPLEICDRKIMAADQGNVVVEGCLGGGADRISDLPDHLLHRILICLPSTAYAARTSVLSRRWRRVWTHLPELALRYCSPERVNAALAAWSAPVLHRLEIAMASRSRYDTAGHVFSWLRFASERLAGELCLSVPGPRGELVLPVCGRFTAISLGPAAGFSERPRLRFQLRPAAGVFTALAALTIKYASMESHELEEVVSSRCPRLKELVLECIVPLSRSDNILSIRSDSLEKLRVVACGTLHDGPLQVATPELQELSLCLSLDAHIIAPKLSKVCWSNSYDPKRHKLVEAGRHLKRLELTSRSLALLGRFDAVDELNQDILLPKGVEEYKRILEDTNRIKCEALVVRILAVSHAFEPIILHFLRKCVGIRKLVVRLSDFVPYSSCELSSCPCDFAQNHLITNGIVLDSLQEVVVMGGTDDQIAKLVNLLQRCNEIFQKKVHITTLECK